VDVDRGQLVWRRLKDVAIVMDLHEIGPVGGRPPGGRHWRRFEWFTQVREDFADGPWVGDERDHVDVVAPRANVADSDCRDGGPELVIQGEHAVVAMPVLPRRRDEIGTGLARRGVARQGSCAAGDRGRLRHGDDREPSEAATQRIAIGSRVRRDGNYGDLARFWAVAPEHAIAARGSVLGVGFEDLVMRIERVREGVVLVRVQAWVTGILTKR